MGMFTTTRAHQPSLRVSHHDAKRSDARTRSLPATDRVRSRPPRPSIANAGNPTAVWAFFFVVKKSAPRRGPRRRRTRRRRRLRGARLRTRASSRRVPAAFRSRAAIGRESLKQRRPESSDRTASPVALARAREKKKKNSSRRREPTGIRQRPVEEQIRRRVRAREQRVVHQRGEGYVIRDGSVVRFDAFRGVTIASCSDDRFPVAQPDVLTSPVISRDIFFSSVRVVSLAAAGPRTPRRAGHGRDGGRADRAAIGRRRHVGVRRRADAGVGPRRRGPRAASSRR